MQCSIRLFRKMEKAQITANSKKFANCGTYLTLFWTFATVVTDIVVISDSRFHEPNAGLATMSVVATVLGCLCFVIHVISFCMLKETSDWYEENHYPLLASYMLSSGVLVASLQDSFMVLGLLGLDLNDQERLRQDPKSLDGISSKRMFDKVKLFLSISSIGLGYQRAFY